MREVEMRQSSSVAIQPYWQCDGDACLVFLMAKNGGRRLMAFPTGKRGHDVCWQGDADDVGYLHGELATTKPSV